MAVNIDCPRCKKPLSIPRKKTGGYVSCPSCSGRFWISKAGKGSSEPNVAVPSMTAVSTPPPAQVSAPPVQVPAPGTAPTDHPAGTPPQAPPPPTSPAVRVPTSGKKVARFISPETTQSTLKAAEDGKLPELHLQQGQTKKKKSRGQSTTVNPLVLFGALSLSAVVSVILVLYQPESDSTSAGKRKQKARADIALEFLPAARDFNDRDNLPELKPYQEYLRQAQRAYSRGDLKAERRYYRKVLHLLRAEQGTTNDALGDPFRDKRYYGVTGKLARDRKLEQWIAKVLSSD